MESEWRTVTLRDVADLRLSYVDKKTKHNEHASFATTPMFTITVSFKAICIL